MRRLLMATAALGLLASPAFAHCDSIDGPVAGAALQALETENVNLALPYAPASAEDEIRDAYTMALEARAAGAAAGDVADRWFMETVVRLHRAGEGAAYTGLQPAGIDYGPVIPAAEAALERGTPDEVIATLSAAVATEVQARFETAWHVLESTEAAAPEAPEAVAEARERVNAEFAFIGYAEGIHAALAAEGHSEGDPGSGH